MGAGWKMESSIDKALIKIIGEVDFTGTPELREEMHDFVKNTAGEVQVDLSELDYLDSSGLASLIELRRILSKEGRSVRIIAVTEQVDRLLNLTQVKSLFGVT
ncbi:STAS domain-containing protein [Maridesulfovibrio hydrothermalis]|uniref:Anti-sigma factor antagonist n=1 Tax=Maridesulfovibrio hydrothermalis AM13 = DSM 14728 TaxID=1121451 RepID=L0R9W7_9BACT|nr:STAS domain-containing protein [Maridesulfovibrio hydrothermalis]CCO23007.1 Stage II sporulation protein [Maridesulfovibrio hydrothermalis AM13 = DSM 14728]